MRGLLEDANVRVITPDLPSHSTPTAGLAEDAEEVREAIRACAPPVAAVGWSYGGRVNSLAAAGEGSVSRLIYIAPELTSLVVEELQIRFMPHDTRSQEDQH